MVSGRVVKFKKVLEDKSSLSLGDLLIVLWIKDDLVSVCQIKRTKKTKATTTTTTNNGRKSYLFL